MLDKHLLIHLIYSYNSFSLMNIVFQELFDMMLSVCLVMIRMIDRNTVFIQNYWMRPQCSAWSAF